MLAVTVSVNYSDILELILPQNGRFFESWIIITTPEDEKTHKVVANSGLKNIELMYFDFKKGGHKFNKGGAIRMCQQTLASRKYNGDVLVLDSDIYLPNEFDKILASIGVVNDVLYTPKLRHDFYSHENFLRNRIDKVYHRSHLSDGFFHLYKFQPHLLYNNSDSAAKCDEEFVKLFRRGQKIECLTVAHFGRDGVNWDGRKGTDFKR